MRPPVLYDLNGGICRITLNRPQKRNALNEKTILGLREAFGRAFADDRVRVILLEGSGGAFCAGADLEELREFQSRSMDENLRDSRNLQTLLRDLYLSPKPVIAQVDGPALGGGCGLAICCTSCYGSPESRFGFPEVRIGFMPALVSVFLIRRLPFSLARELLLTGQILTAEKAERIGLISGVFPAETLAGETRNIAERLCRDVSPGAIRRTGEWLGPLARLPLDEALELSALLNAEARLSVEAKKGISSFLGKNKVGW